MKIQNIEIPHGLCLAPLAGVSDRAFRTLCRAHGAEYLCSEMVSAAAICYGDKKTPALARFDEAEMPIAIQLFGHDPAMMAEAARRIATGTLAEDVRIPTAIDINMGCPVKKIVSNGEGSALMKEPVRAAEIVAAVAKASHVPVTVKMRLGFEAGSETYLLLGQLVQESGAQMITLHARTRSQFYEGRADWSAIGKLKRRVSIPVVGNGDVTCWQDALRMREETGCDGVAVGRAAQGNPWIFRQIADAMAGKAAVEPTNEEKFDVLRRHLHALAQLKGEAVAVREMRRHIVCYVRGMRDAARLRVKVNAITDIGEMEEALKAFMLEGKA